MKEVFNPLTINENSGLDVPSDYHIYTFIKLAEDIFALDCENVLEVIKLVQLNCPEKMPSHIAGLLEYDGEIISVIDIKAVLQNKTETYDINSMIAILKAKNHTFGIIVNKVLDIKKADLSDIQPTPYTSVNNFVSAIYNYNDTQCAILNIESLSKWILNHSGDYNSNSKNVPVLPSDAESSEILEKRKQDLIEKSKKNPYALLADKDEFVSFRVGTNKYCIKMKDIKGFYKVNTDKMTKVSCTPDFIMGLINIKGDFICVIDVKNYFHSKKSHTPPQSGTVIVLNSKEFKIGILADEIKDNIQIKPEEIKFLAKQETRAELLQYVRESEIYLIINVAEMLNSDKLFVK